MAVHLFRSAGSWPRPRSGAEYQYEEVLHAGHVLGTGTEDRRIMSDVWGVRAYATVWNPEEGRPESVTLSVADWQRASHDWHDWSYRSRATVDATPEVLVAHELWKAAETERKLLASFEANLKRGRALAGEVRKGSRVVLCRKRCKVPFGTKGRVFWLGDSHYGDRVGFKDEDEETYWTALRNVEVEEGHEDLTRACPECGDGGWLPANDGKGGKVRCPECKRRAVEAVKRAKEVEEALAEVEADVAPVRKGSRVKLPGGGSGKVFWLGESKYGPGLRVGVEGDDGRTHWATYEEVEAAA